MISCIGPELESSEGSERERKSSGQPEFLADRFVLKEGEYGVGQDSPRQLHFALCSCEGAHVCSDAP